MVSITPSNKKKINIQKNLNYFNCLLILTMSVIPVTLWCYNYVYKQTLAYYVRAQEFFHGDEGLKKFERVKAILT